MACSRLAAAPSAGPAAARARSLASSTAPAFARVPAAHRTCRSSRFHPPPPGLGASALRRQIRRVADRFGIAASLPAGYASGGLSVRGGKAASPVAVGAGLAAAAPVAGLDGRPTTAKQPIIVIDNYDSFTYNLCQVYGLFVFRTCSLLPNCFVL